MAFNHRKKKTIRRKQRFSKHKSAKTHSRRRVRIMRGGKRVWKVTVYGIRNNEWYRFKDGIFTFDDDISEERTLGTLFNLVEAFGAFTSSFGSKKIDTGMERKAVVNKPKSIDEMSIVLKQEYERIFWATGIIDMSLYENNCTFADPFSSFGGEDSIVRFRNNALNLGKFVLNPSMKVTSVEVIKNSYRPDCSGVIKVSLY